MSEAPASHENQVETPELVDANVDFDGVEVEIEEPLESERPISEPFDPTKIRVRTWSPTIDLLMTRIRENEINLMPEFQRQAGIWSKEAQRRLIESVLIRIPLPAFYMDATDEEHLIVIDGLQRLTTLRQFIVDEELKLTGLEFLDDLKRKKFSQLPRPFQRRIQETQVTVYLIEKGTPEKVKYNIFKRINTGGLPLSQQEIRHALNPGEATRFLKELAQSHEFHAATAGGVSDKRMVDRECVLRFVAFTITPFGDYNTRDLDHFLHEQMAAVNQMSSDERDRLARRFKRAMTAAHTIFGDDAFRKRYTPSDMRRPVNKALFESWAVNLDACSDDEIDTLITKQDNVKKAFMNLMKEDRDFESSVTVSTADPRKVRKRFKEIHQLIRDVLA